MTGDKVRAPAAHHKKKGSLSTIFLAYLAIDPNFYRFIPRSTLGGALFLQFVQGVASFSHCQFYFRRSMGGFVGKFLPNYKPNIKLLISLLIESSTVLQKIMTPVKKPCAGNRRKRKLHNGDKVHGYLRETNSIV